MTSSQHLRGTLHGIEPTVEVGPPEREDDWESALGDREQSDQFEVGVHEGEAIRECLSERLPASN